MPEGDTVRRVADYLRPRLAGRPIDTGHVRHRPDIVLEGRRIEEVYPRGKHLFFALDDDTLLRSHLGMHGSWHRYPAGVAWRRPAGQASIVLRVDGQDYVCFLAEDVEHLRAHGARQRQIEGRLGPDLLAADVDFGRILERARRFLDPEALVCDLLLDQRVAAGIGNIFKSEVLFVASTHPGRRAGDLDDAQVTRLFRTGQELLQRNVEREPRITRLPGEGDAAGRRSPRPRGLPPTDRGGLWVYRRAGRPCFRCGAPIARDLMGRTWRATYWCDRCQR